jgi:hypothetical protein
MDADERGWLSPSEAIRLRRSRHLAFLNCAILSIVMACLIARIYEKDRQIDGLIRQSQSLIQSVERVVNQNGLPERPAENLR